MWWNSPTVNTSKKEEMMTHSIGAGTTGEFIAEEFKGLDLNDKRLNARAELIFHKLQTKLGSCIRRLFTDFQEARQAYDFF